MTCFLVRRPWEHDHLGTDQYRGEVANLSRNVVVESADPKGERGHTMYHRNSAGSISYAEFRHLGKEGVLGRYSLHYHLAGDTMRGSYVLGASIWDSGNRWLTIHGTNYLVVRDCVGYRSAGHGFFLEDGTEVDNVLDRNLAVGARPAPKLPGQVLPFHRPADGVYHPNYDNHVYRDLTISRTDTEPFNRGHDDLSVQYGALAVDGLTFAGVSSGDSMPLIQISDDNPTGKGVSHFR